MRPSRAVGAACARAPPIPLLLRNNRIQPSARAELCGTVAAGLQFGPSRMWELIFFMLVLKIPLVYLCWVVWWAIKAVPEVGEEGGTEGLNWKPWQRPAGPRPRRGSPHGTRSGRAFRKRRGKVAA
jgi:hypothetical protein